MLIIEEVFDKKKEKKVSTSMHEACFVPFIIWKLQWKYWISIFHIEVQCLFIYPSASFSNVLVLIRHVSDQPSAGFQNRGHQVSRVLNESPATGKWRDILNVQYDLIMFEMHSP